MNSSEDIDRLTVDLISVERRINERIAKLETEVSYLKSRSGVWDSVARQLYGL